MDLAFTSISSTVKEIITEQELSRLTCVVGEEESFKSAIGDSYRLALTGKHPIGPNPSDLISLAVDPHKGISIKMTGEGISASWSLPIDPDTGKAKTPSRPTLIGRPFDGINEEQRLSIIPSDPLRVLLEEARGPTKLREAMLLRFGGGLSALPEPIVLQDEERAEWDAVIEQVKRSLSADEQTADVLLAKLTEKLRSEISQKRAQIRPITKYIADKRQLLQQGSAGLELLPQKEKQLKQAEAWEQAEKLRPGIEAARQEVERLDRELLEAAGLEEKAAEQGRICLQAAEDACSDALAKRGLVEEELLLLVERAMMFDHYVRLYEKAATAGSDKCPYCEHADPKLTERLESHRRMAALRHEQERAKEQEVVQLTGEAARAEAFVNAQKMANVKAEHEYDLKLLDLRRSFSEAGKLLKNCEEAVKDAPTAYTGPSSAELRKQVDQLKELAKAKVDLVKEGARLRTLEAELATLQAFENEAKEMQQRVVTEVADRASKEVSSGMFGQRTALLDPVKFRWSVTDQASGVPRIMGAMSGTQRVSLNLGFLRAWTRGAPARYALFDDDDLPGLSKQGMKDFFGACEKAVADGDLHQVLVICPDVWLDQIPATWLKIVKKRKVVVL